jgi:hypothetical protein
MRRIPDSGSSTRAGPVPACWPAARWGTDRASINKLILLVIDLWQQRRGTNLPLVPLVNAWVVAPSYPLCRQDYKELKHCARLDGRNTTW